MTIYNITFSPTGGTKRVADILANEIAENAVSVELCVPKGDIKVLSVGKSDVCIIAVPSFGGRVPEEAVKRISSIKANGARAILVCVYGNRAYDDTLLELKAVAETVGFRCIAAVSAVAEHSVIRDIAKGRPDASDEAELKEIAAKIKEKIDAQSFEFEASFPAKTTYKERGKSKMVPQTSEACIKCGACAGACPMSAISRDNPKLTDEEKCISCLKCISVCPKNAKYLNGELVAMLGKRLSEVCSIRKGNELFL